MRFHSTRREFLLTSGLIAAGVAGLPRGARAAATPDDFLSDLFDSETTAGLSACAFTTDEILWSGAIGFADVAKKRPMTTDTIQNIASISKIVTATAVMRLVSDGRMALDGDINACIDVEVRNPKFADRPITVEQLLMHTSSISDGPAYGDSYACGDPTVTLERWIKGYFTPGGEFHDAEANFAPLAPEADYEYSNVGYGLLAYAVECVTEQDFSRYCREHIFAPLGMTNTGWRISEIDVSTHAVPYEYRRHKRTRPRPNPLLSDPSIEQGLLPHCLYSFPNYPDGLVRTSARQLARLFMAYLNDGAFDGYAVLQPGTVGRMLEPHVRHTDTIAQGLCWVAKRDEAGHVRWEHSGGDPGVSTLGAIDLENGCGAITLCNTEISHPVDDLQGYLLDYARRA